MAIKKLIEVALPLEAINAACVREKVIRHGHPSTLHLWWARRPLAAARAVIWGSLVDDPSSHPELFPSEEAQNKERNRLFSILESLVVWENSNNQDILNKAKAEILKYNDGELPELLDPFAGGGAIPLEAQRLGLKAHAHDLNPVAVLINKAMLELPIAFLNKAPINPKCISSLDKSSGWQLCGGLAKDIEYYGNVLKEKAFNFLKNMYPEIDLPYELGGGKGKIIARIWVRTIKCCNPACSCMTPLASSFVLSKQKGKESYIVPTFDESNNGFKYFVHMDSGEPPISPKVSRGAIFKCLKCGEIIGSEYIKQESRNHKIESKLMAIVVEGNNKRIYLDPSCDNESFLPTEKPASYPTGKIGGDKRALWTPPYGLDTFESLFTNRQLHMLTTFSRLLDDIKAIVLKDAISDGMINDGKSLVEGGKGALAYAETIITYLAFVIDKLADYHSSVCSWNSSGQKMRNTFGRQGIPMVWDYAECNPFCSSSGSFDNMLQWVVKCVTNFVGEVPGEAEQYNASEECFLRNVMISTDPPYYDNIGYADLSDFFYIWLKYSLGNVYREMFNTVLTPKIDELIATPYRFNGSTSRAKSFFEDRMLLTCKQLYNYTRDDIPVTIFYAYKQGESNGSAMSSGWETMLNAIVTSGFTITGTWPIRTEMANRTVAYGTNALASSIVLVCRKRSEDAPVTTRRNMINTLRREMRTALQKLQSSNIAPVDMSQSAIGPGMAVFSRFSKVLEADGTPMSVRSALAIINEELDAYFNEQVGSMDSASRFCVDLYTQLGYNQIKYGEAEVLANAKGISIPALEKRGILYAKAGVLHLYERGELPTDIDVQESNIWLLTQQLTHLMSKDGIMGCAKAIVDMVGTNIENARDLAYRLYDLAEKKKWSEEAYAYNSLVVAWPDIQSAAAELRRTRPQQQSLF